MYSVQANELMQHCKICAMQIETSLTRATPFVKGDAPQDSDRDMNGLTNQF